MISVSKDMLTPPQKKGVKEKFKTETYSKIEQYFNYETNIHDPQPLPK